MVQAELAYVLKVIDETSSTMEKIQSGIGLVGQTLGQLGGGFASVGNIMTDFAAGGPAGAVIGALGETAKGLQDCIKDATASEAVFTSLGAAVTRSGTSWDTVSAATKSALISMEETTTYSKDTLAGALERLMTFGLSYDDAMKALGESVDFAAAKHMDLESAATLVGKAMDGNTAILKRYGVDLETTKDQAAELKLAHDAASGAIKALGAGVDAWVTSVTAAIGADTTFENGLSAAKDKAAYLVEQFKAGNVDLPQFTQAMTSLGVQLDEAKMKGGSATEVLSKLNEQFGGAAQAAAGTYAGIQERLKNATQEVGEKIGTIFLPALASLTEGMIPVVDNLGKGVDAISAWLTEVGKMPEVQGIVAAVGDAFGGFMKYLQDLWGFMVEQFGPVLKELMAAFKELWDALSPIGEALGEMFSAMTGGGEGMDLFKVAIQAIVFEIKGVVVIIQTVAPYIKEFADAFKAAADFITPILKEIHEGITAFLDGLKTAFQDFYTWLVGGSLWTDMWNQMLTIASSIIMQLISDIGGKLFAPMQTAFTTALTAIQTGWTTAWQAIQTSGQTVWSAITATVAPWIDGVKTTVTTATDALKTTWVTGWQAIQTSFETVIAQIQTGVNTNFDAMRAFITDNMGQYAPIANSALNATWSAIDAGLALIKGDWQGALDQTKDALTSWGTAAQATMRLAMSNLQTAVQSGLDLIKSGWDTFVGGIQSGISTLEAAFASAGGSIKQTLSDVQAATAPATAAVTSSFTSAFDTISTAATGFWNWLVGGSLWPEMMDRMHGITESGMQAVHEAFTSSLAAISSTVSAGAQSIVSTMQSTFSQVSQLVQNIASSIGGGLQQGVGMTADAADALHNAIVSAVSGAGANEAFQNLWTSAGGLWSQLVSGAKTAAEAIHDSFVALAGGGDVSNAFQALWASAGGLYTQLTNGSITTEEAVRESMLAMTGAVGSGMDAITFDTQEATQAFQKLFTGALNTVSTATSNFWNWLVGGSVWPEGMTAIKTTTQDSMTKVTTITSNALQVLGDKFESSFEAIQNEHVAFWDNYFVPKFTESLAIIQAQSTAWWTQFTGLFTQQFGVLQGAWSDAWTAMQSIMQSILSQMSDTAGSVLDSILSKVQTTMTGIQQAASGLKTELVSGSIWPDMLALLSSMTSDSLASLTDMFNKTFGPDLENATSRSKSILDVVKAMFNFGDIKGATAGLAGAFSTAGTEKVTAAAGAAAAKLGGMGAGAAGAGDLVTQGKQADQVAAAFAGLGTTIDAVGTKFSSFVTKFGTTITAFQHTTVSTLQAIKTDWSTTLTQIEQTLTTAFATITKSSTAFYTGMHTNLTAWFTTIKQLFVADLTQIIADWAKGWTLMNEAASVACQTLSIGITQTFALITQTITTGVGQFLAVWQGGWQQMVMFTQMSCMQIVQQVQMMVNQVLMLVAQMRMAMTGHSVWTDMLTEMQTQAHTALGNIVSDFGGAFSVIPLSVPSLSIGAAAASPAPPVAVTSAPAWPSQITVPVQVRVDGQTVAQTVEKRLIQQRKIRAGGGRGTSRW